MILWELFTGFLKIGCFSFGGAYSAIPLIREVVISSGWMDDETLTYMIAVSESTPGPIMVNMATYIGSSRAGIVGALIATVAVILPAFLIVIILMTLLKNLLKNTAVQATLTGLKASVIGIILATGSFMILENCFGGISNVSVDIIAIVLTVALGAIWFGAKKVTKNRLSPILLICVSGIAGVLLYGWK